MSVATDLSRLLPPPVCEGRVQVALLCPPRGRDAGGRGQVVLRLPVPHTHQGEHHAELGFVASEKCKARLDLDFRMSSVCSYQKKSTLSVYKLKDCVVHLYIFLMHKMETFGFELINSMIKLIRKHFLLNDILTKHCMIF